MKITIILLLLCFIFVIYFTPSKTDKIEEDKIYNKKMEIHRLYMKKSMKEINDNLKESIELNNKIGYFNFKATI